MKKLLLVEDDVLIAQTLSLTLSYRGFAITNADSVYPALRRLDETDFDIAVVDVSLPDGNGFDLCTKMRESHPRLPILMLTARTDEESAVRGIHSGADDYVRKPCGLDELTARLNRLLGRNVRQRSFYSFRSLRIDSEKRLAHVSGVLVRLRKREFEILLLLMKHAGEVVTREQVLKSIDEKIDLFDRAVDSHVCRLRAKLRTAHLIDARIVSVYGVGYRLEEI